MFEALAERLLGNILGEYIEDFSAQNLKIGILSGQVILKNIVLKKDIIKKLNLPLKIKYSRLGTLKMNIPWKSLTSSKIEVVLEGFELVVAELPISQWNCKNTKIIDKRKKEIEAYCQSVLDDFVKKGEKGKQKKDEGYFSKLTVKIIDNLQVTIKDIHIRYEDQISKQYSFGVTLEEFKLYTVNSKGEPEYIDRSKAQYSNEPLRKKLELYNIGIYWNQKSQFFNQGNYGAKMSGTIAKRGQASLSHNYVILLSSQANLLQRQSGKQFVAPQIDLQIGLEDIKIAITNTQLQQIISIAQRLQKYTRRVKQENRHKLTKDQMVHQIQTFFTIFPQYFEGYGKKLSKQKMQRLQQILQKVEVQNFTKGISQFLKQKQKERIKKQKQQKNKGWFWSKPKELTKEQLQEIEKYLNQNFGQEISLIKRPQDYQYIKISFKLAKLEVLVANTLAIIKEGIETAFEDLEISFALREGGYQLELALEDIKVNMFKQIGVEPREYKQVLHKATGSTSALDSSYLKLSVAGNPTNKKHLNTDIQLATSELIVLFDPKIITIATEFADLRLSKENRQAAIQKFGEIKEITESAVAETIDKPKKAQIGVDLLIRSVTIAVPFSPHKQDLDCWALNLGSVNFTTDQQTLLRKQVSDDLPLDVFNLELKNFSFKHYKSIEHLKTAMFTRASYEDKTHAVIDNLNLLLRLELYGKATEERAKIKLQAKLPSLSMNLCNFTYKNILQISNAFQMQERAAHSRQTTRIDQKKEIQQKAAKIGFVYIKDSITKIWKKYVAIMSENYIYLFLNKSDKDYYAYYYIKGAQLDKYSDPLDKEKPFHFKIKNKVNEVVFGFDKEEQIDDWIIKIQALTKEKQFVSNILSVTLNNNLGEGILNLAQQKKQQKRHNDMSLSVTAQIESIALKVFTSDSTEEQVVNLNFNKLSTQINLHESKKTINLQLFSLSLDDSMRRYKNKELTFFLQTKRQLEDENLIGISIQQLNKDHPQFANTDSSINISFGTLACNYKCETVKALMAFFIPPSPPQQQRPESKEQDINSTINSAIEIRQNETQNFSLKLKLIIKQISITLVNQKIKTVVGTLGITNLDLYTGISQKRTVLKGSLKDLYYFDTTNYPNTIITQQQQYNNKRYILTANIGQAKDMLHFNIEILKTVNQCGKSMLIDIIIANLTTYYVQQPVLRLITYLNTQMLPSFETAPKQAKPIPVKDTKPDISPMYLKVQLTNISLFIETEHQYTQKDKQQYMQLNIERITVANDSVYRNYLKSAPQKKIILVENYSVKLYAMSITVHYFDMEKIEHSYKLTNNLDLSVSVDLIANPLYYKRQFQDKFANGMRVECKMTPFFMRINHDDYSFIMKCLNWAVTHNDGVQNELFNIVDVKNKIEQGSDKKEQDKVQKDPFYLTVSMDCISLFVTKDNLPIAFLDLNRMTFNMLTEDVMQMDFTLHQLYGTSIEHNKTQKTLIQRGIFNSLGFTSKHEVSQVSDLESFIKEFTYEARIEKQKSQAFLRFQMISAQKQTNMTIQMSQLCVQVDVRLLMILSNLAITDEKYIKGPSPVIKIQEIQDSLEAQKNEEVRPSPKKFSMMFDLKRLVGSISDSTKQKFFFIQGEIFFSMINYGDKTINEIEEITRQHERSISHSSMNANLKNFTMYFSRVIGGKIMARRQFLQPMLVQFDQKRYYHCEKDIHLLQTYIRAKTTQLFLTASLKDMLNINKIVQDNLKVLGEFASESKPKEQVVEQVVNRQDLAVEINKLQQKLTKQIQLKTKIKGEIAPMQIQIVNDCDNNFMPVIRLIIDETQPTMQQTIINSKIFVVPIINLSFFNPRSSRWQPMVQPFKSTITYSTFTLNNQQSTALNVQTQSKQQTSSLKINISTQMLSTLLAAKDIIQMEQENIDKNVQGKQIEISPFIFHNITNQKIYIMRGQNAFELPPLFKGPVRIANEKQIIFKLQGKVHKFSSDHYGVLRISQSNYFIKFDTQKLNRIIQFIPQLLLKNKLQKQIFVKRYGNGEPQIQKFQPDESIPLDNINSFAVCLNGTEYTEPISTKGIKLGSCMVGEKKNFLILLSYQDKLNKYGVVSLLPPFVIYNCLPKDTTIQFIQKAKLLSTKLIHSQQSHSIYTNEEVSTLQLKLQVSGYTWTKKFKFRPQKDNECQLTLSDQGNHETILNYIFSKDKNTNQYNLIIYCKKFVINETCDKLIVYGNLQADQKQKKRSPPFKLLGGQKPHDDSFDDKVIMIGSEVGNQLRVCGSHSVFDFATPISIGGIGSSQSRIVVDQPFEGKKDSLFTVIGVEISAIKMIKGCDIYCKKIVLKNKSIIVNTTQMDLQIRQEYSNKYKFISEANSKKNFIFGLPEIPGRTYKYTISGKGYKQSHPVVLNTQGTVYFKLERLQENKQGKQQLYFKIYVKSSNSYSFYEITQITDKDFPYQITVKSNKLKVFAPSLNQTAVKGTSVRFMNQNDSQSTHSIILNVLHSQSKQQITVKVFPDDLKFKEKLLVPIEVGGLVGSIVVIVYVTISDKQRCIVVDQLSKAQEEVEIQQSALSISISSIILSINQNSQSIQIPFESMVLTVKRLQFIKYETDKKVQYQLKIGFFQIDQAFPHRMSSPVIITPYKFQQFTRQKDPKSIFNFTIVFSKEFAKNTFINEICVDFSDIVAIFSADFITLVTLISNQFAAVINFKQETYFIDKKLEKWKDMPIPPQENAVYIKSIKIAPFIVDLSVQLNIKKLNLQNNLLVTTILSTVGIVMSNIDSAPINMTGIEISDCIDTVDSITNKLVTHYKDTCVKQFYKIFGSLNIIGNPLSLFRNISTGVKDLTQKPAKGFVNGPAQFGIGLVEGTGSLVAHSVGGAFNSISKVTGTVSSGLATLAFDKEFEEHREKQKMKKPQNVIQGLSKGGKAIFYGFKEGITGVFTQPIQNARKQGALGFVKGAAKGLAGLVVKPVTGIIDFASKTTEGIKNNALMFEDKAREERMRYPRVFYSECFILKEYSQRDSELYYVITKVENQNKFSNPAFYDAFQSGNGQFLVILQSAVAFIDISSHKIRWAIEYAQLMLENNKKKKALLFKKSGRSSSIFGNDSYEVVIQEQQIRELMTELILSLQKQRLHS